MRTTGRALLGWQELGDPLAGESGLDWSGGANAAGELTVDATLGAHWWFGVTGRASGRLAAGETLDPGDPLTWPGWPLATGRAQVGTARQQGGAWTLTLPRAMAGVRLGNWALSAGWEPRRVGPGRGGGLTLDHGGATFPALTGRRTAPFRWSGIMRWLAPSELLLRAGTLSERQVRLFPASGLVLTRQNPWFMEWLLGWEPVSWFRFTATQAAMAASQDGTLWPDILQINFPLIGTTWAERPTGRSPTASSPWGSRDAGGTRPGPCCRRPRGASGGSTAEPTSCLRGRAASGRGSPHPPRWPGWPCSRPVGTWKWNTPSSGMIR